MPRWAQGGFQHAQPGGLEPASPGRSPKSLPGGLGLWFFSPQSLIFDEVDLSDASVAETSTKNINNSFTVREVWGCPHAPPPQHPAGRHRRPLPTELWGTPQRDPVLREVAPVAVCRLRWRLLSWGLAGRGAASQGDTGTWLLQVITPFRKLILCAENRKEMEDWISALKSVQKWEIHEVTQAGGGAGACLRVGTPQELGVPLAAGQELLPLAQPCGGWAGSGGLGGREHQLGVPGD